MKVLVCGSRTYSGINKIRERLKQLPNDTIVIHGNAVGADKLGAQVAKELNFQVIAFPANWNQFGRNAGFIRNIQMLDEQPNLVIAFWDGKSGGTRHTINNAKSRNIPVEIIF